MSVQEFVDILHELIAVDSAEGLVKSTYRKGSNIIVEIIGGGRFVVIVAES